MPKILKGKPLPHVVVVDTNILWCKDKGPAVNPEFDTFWSQHEKLVDLELIIPEAVRDELLFQQATSCLKSIDRVIEQFTEISSITGVNYAYNANRAQIVLEIENKIDKWIKSKGAKVHATPFGSINWSALYHAAIWRLPPFTADPKNPDNEKGFRDALIFETVAHYVANELRQVNLAFVCNDFLLRTTTAKRLHADKRFAAYESLADFSSYIKLTREKLANAFIARIVKRAQEKFFKKGDTTCLWLRENIWAATIEQYSASLMPDEAYPQFPISQGILPLASLAGTQPTISSSLFALGNSPLNWERNGAQVFINRAEFLEIEGERTYHWKVPFYNVALYSKGSEQKLLITTFNAFWHALVKNDARFYDVKLEEIKLVEKIFRSVTPEDVQRYGAYLQIQQNLATIK